MQFDLISLFPEMFTALTQYGVSGRAVARGQVTLRHWHPRDYTQDAHRSVDDRPYGGGPGMVMRVEPLREAILAARAVAPPLAPVIYLSPQGRRLNQPAVQNFAQQPGLILLCGRYEGVDERLLTTLVDEEWSIGDYVLSGGELAAMVLMDSIIRLLPAVLGDADSAAQDSFMNGLLDCPHYTRPEVSLNQTVPTVLLSGDHAAIAQWRLKQALGRTWLRRPDLLTSLALDPRQQALLEEFIAEQATTPLNSV
ncbi:MAG: tRNA (guanosine(37)-N1)-methyltransferase TrmD [Gammaproteobacteria bacterium]|nr:tRNA (guanosine(37)-N1)-methyltransferase TrmD [Gammaproteobacteria bacterium]